MARQLSNFKSNIILDSRYKSAGVNKANAGLVGLAKTAKKAGIVFAAIVAAVVAVVKVMQVITKVHKEFETAQINLSARTFASKEVMAELSKEVRDLTRNFTTTAPAMLEGLAILGSMKSEIVEDVVAWKELNKEVLLFAEGGKLEFPVAAKIIVGALNQFDFGVSEAARVTNVLSAAARVGAADVAFIGKAFEDAGVIAATYKISLEGTAAAIAVLSRSNLAASKVGTHYRNILSRLATTELPRYNVLLVGQQQAFENLKEDQLSAVELEALFGMEVKGTAQFLINNTDRLLEYKDAVTDTNDARVAFLKRSKGLEKAEGLLSNAISELSNSFGELTSPGMTDFVKQLTRAIQKVTDFVKESRTLEAIIYAIGLVFRTLWAAIELVILTFLDLVLWVENVVGAFDKLDLLNPASIFYVLRDAIESTGKFLMGFWSNVKSVVGIVEDELEPAIKKVKDAADSLPEAKVKGSGKGKTPAEIQAEKDKLEATKKSLTTLIDTIKESLKTRSQIEQEALDRDIKAIQDKIALEVSYTKEGLALIEQLKVAHHNRLTQDAVARAAKTTAEIGNYNKTELELLQELNTQKVALYQKDLEDTAHSEEKKDELVRLYREKLMQDETIFAENKELARQDRLAALLENTTLGFEMEREQRQEQYENELEQLREFLTNKEITEEEFAQGQKDLKQKTEDDLCRIDEQAKKAALSRDKEEAIIAAKIAKAKAKLLLIIAAGLLRGSEKGQKAMFLLQQGFAISKAMIATQESAALALATYPAPNFPAQALALKAGYLHVAAIAAQTAFSPHFAGGGGGGGGGSLGSIGSVSAAQSMPGDLLPTFGTEQAATTRVIEVNITGLPPNEIFTTDQVRILMEQIQEQAGDGVTFNFAEG